MVTGYRQFDVILVGLDPTEDSEIAKTRPCLIVSPDELNAFIRTVIVAPMTTTEKPYPTRVSVTFKNRSGQVALDQIRTIDKSRIVRRLGSVDRTVQREVSGRLVEMFALADP